MARSNQKILLAVLVVIWVVLLAYRIIFHEEPKRVPLTYRTGQTITKAGSKGSVRHDLILRLDLLNQEPPAPGSGLKNLFLPLHYEPPKSLTPPTTLPPPPPPPSPEEIAAEQARQQLSQFRYLGYLNRGDKEQAFLSKGNDLFIVKRGDAIIGTFLLKEANSNFAVIQDSATKVEITLALTGS
jgi:hypothetical protein